MVAVSIFPQLAMSSTTPFMLDLTFNFQHYHFHFFASLLSLPLFWLSTFIKSHIGLLLGSNTTIHSPVLCIKRITDVQSPVTNRLSKKWHDWSMIMMHIYYLHKPPHLSNKFLLITLTPPILNYPITVLSMCSLYWKTCLKSLEPRAQKNL